MIIDRLTPATRNGLANAIRGWPKIMSLYQAFKKRKLYSSWSIIKIRTNDIVWLTTWSFPMCVAIRHIDAPGLVRPHVVAEAMLRTAWLNSMPFANLVASESSWGKFWLFGLLWASFILIPWHKKHLYIVCSNMFEQLSLWGGKLRWTKYGRTRPSGELMPNFLHMGVISLVTTDNSLKDLDFRNMSLIRLNVH